MNQQTLTRIEEFRVALEAFCNEKNMCKHLYKVVIEVQIGRKYARIVRREQWPDQEPSGGSAHCFVDLETGSILKADGFKKPAPQIRGSIFKDDFGVGTAVGEYGAAYLR